MLNSKQMDDCVLDDPTRAFMVASLALCMDRLRSRRSLYRSERAPWSNVSCHFPSCRQNKLWPLRKSVVHLQPGRDGLHLVWCTGEHWRGLRQSHAESDVAERQ